MEDYQILLTPSALLGFLAEIDEFQNVPVSVAETADGNIQVVIGDSAYTIDCSQAEDVNVDNDVVEDVADINEQAYESLIEESEDFEDVDVEGGLLYEAAKTLAIGGLARLAGKTVKDMLR